MNVEQIVADWLTTHGYDGLYDEDCGCCLDDLRPCSGEGAGQCKAGYKVPCEEGDEGWIIGPDKPALSGEGG